MEARNRNLESKLKALQTSEQENEASQLRQKLKEANDKITELSR